MAATGRTVFNVPDDGKLALRLEGAMDLGEGRLVGKPVGVSRARDSTRYRALPVKRL